MPDVKTEMSYNGVCEAVHQIILPRLLSLQLPDLWGGIL